jgi:hypothetical protein
MKVVDKHKKAEKKPYRAEVRSAMYPAINLDDGNFEKMTAQQHSMMLNDGTTNPHVDALSFDAVTPTEMGNLNDNL